MAARSTLVGLVALLLLAGCGGGDDDGPALEAVPPAAPADLCALVPASVSRGLEASGSSDDSGDPRAVCALGSTSGPEVRAVVTWLQLEDQGPATTVWTSQCDAIDRTRLAEPRGFEVAGADATCAGAATRQGTDTASVAVQRGREVLTARVQGSGGEPAALDLAGALLAGVLDELDTGR